MARRVRGAGRMRVALLVGLSLLFACADAPPDRARLGVSSSRIIRGQASSREQDAVLSIGSFEGRFACTATMIAPNLLVTARHCVSRLPSDSGFGCRSDGTVASSDPTAARLGADYTPSKLYVWVGSKTPVLSENPKPDALGKQILHDAAPVLCGHDLAFVVLDRDLDLPTAKLRLEADPVAGEALTIVGFGYDETGAQPAARRQRAVTIATMGPYDSTAGGGLSPSEILLTEGNCDGDSGGPGFAADGSLVSVDSRSATTGKGPSQCEGAGDVHLAVSGFAELARGALAAAGHALPAADAGTPPDAGTAEVGPEPVATQPGSCAIGASRRTAPCGAALALLALALTFARRRGRPRP